MTDTFIQFVNELEEGVYDSTNADSLPLSKGDVIQLSVENKNERLYAEKSFDQTFEVIDVVKRYSKRYFRDIRETLFVIVYIKSVD